MPDINSYVVNPSKLPDDEKEMLSFAVVLSMHADKMVVRAAHAMAELLRRLTTERTATEAAEQRIATLQAQFDELGRAKERFIAAINEAFERAAQECEKYGNLVAGKAPVAYECANYVRALASTEKP